MVLNHKMIWEPLNCGLILDKVYARLNENRHKISFKNSFMRKYKHFRPEVQATLSEI